MILILGKDDDNSTDNVLDWIYHSNKYVVKISIEDLLAIKKIEIENGKTIFYFKNIVINEKDIEAIWIRKWEDNKKKLNGILDNFFDKEEADINTKELNVIHSFLELCFSNTKALTGNNNLSANKPYQLLIAQVVGLITPPSLIATNSENVNLKYSKEEIITKLMGGMYMKKKEDKYYASYTSILDKGKLPIHFIPSLIQKKIEKEFEIRTFYINEKCYSASIFSQENIKTQIDYRRYDYKNPNRIVTYKLPLEIEIKIKLLMNKLGLNTGSLDFMMSKDGILYFLEVNPEGVYENISYNCNYYLEKHIANFLINEIQS